MAAQPERPSLHWPSLLAGTALMLGGTAYPLLFARPGAGADHPLLLLGCWAMSAGLVRGVGFVPQRRLWRWLLSGWSCAAALAGAAALLVLRSPALGA